MKLGNHIKALRFLQITAEHGIRLELPTRFTNFDVKAFIYLRILWTGVTSLFPAERKWEGVLSWAVAYRRDFLL